MLEGAEVLGIAAGLGVCAVADARANDSIRPPMRLVVDLLGRNFIAAILVRQFANPRSENGTGPVAIQRRCNADSEKSRQAH